VEEMNTGLGLSESATIAILLLLIFGAVSFYLYSRVNYTEKRMSLMENMLLDIKMSLDSMNKEEPEYSPEPVGAPTPLQAEEGEVLPEEENYYKETLESAADEPEVPASSSSDSSSSAAPPEVTAVSSVTVNYESMTKDELIALAEKRGIKLGKRPGRKDLVSALRKGEEVNGPSSGSELFPMAASLEETDGVVADSLE
jgi:hypothetical protein